MVDAALATWFTRYMEGASKGASEMSKTTIQIGTEVSYEDMANPLRKGQVSDVVSSRWGTGYEITWEDGTFDYSDLHQRGWKIG